MRRCLNLASLGIGSVSPNPMVGCVIVNEGVIIGEGYHAKNGGIMRKFRQSTQLKVVK